MEHLGERYIEREVERFVKGMHTYTPAQLKCMAQHYASALEDHEHELHRIHALREDLLRQERRCIGEIQMYYGLLEHVEDLLEEAQEIA
jgi:uncharacterized protein YydD (DUF2326 family)